MIGVVVIGQLLEAVSELLLLTDGLLCSGGQYFSLTVDMMTERDVMCLYIEWILSDHNTTTKLKSAATFPNERTVVGGGEGRRRKRFLGREDTTDVSCTTYLRRAPFR